MWSFKHIVAVVSIGVVASWLLLPLVSYGPLLEDSEFDEALVRAESVQLPNIEEIRDYPFSTITRREAAVRYVKFAQDVGIVPVLNTCVFEDLNEVRSEEERMILLSCQYWFFQGVQGKFYPDRFLTKSASLVGLIRGMFPGKQFVDVIPYRDPYVSLANELGITSRESGPYLEYLITKYELLLQLRRATKKHNRT